MSVRCHSFGVCWDKVSNRKGTLLVGCKYLARARLEVGKASCLSWICLLVLHEMREAISFGRNSGGPIEHNHVECCDAELLLDDRMERALTSISRCHCTCYSSLPYHNH